MERFVESPLDATAQQLVDQSYGVSSGASQRSSSRTSGEGTDSQSLPHECTSPKTEAWERRAAKAFASM